MSPKLAPAALLLFLAAAASAVETAHLSESSGEDFAKGEAENVYVDPDGRPALAPERDELLCEIEHAWCLAAGPDGVLFVGTVPEGKVYRLAGGEPEVVLETGEAGVFSLLLLPDGTLLAGTGSEGKVWRLPPGGEPEVAADLEENYCFALAREPGGAVLAATGGGKGRIYRLGESPELVYDSPGEHILALAVGPNGEIYAASGDRGAVYEVAGSSAARVLYAAEQPVVQDLLVDSEGNVYAATAAIGEGKRGGEAAAVKSIISEVQARQGEAPVSPTPTTPPAERTYQTTNAVYRIGRSGEVRKVFEEKGALVLSLAQVGGRILAGTGGKAAVYSIHPEGLDRARLFEPEATHVHDLAALPEGGFAAGLGTPGKVTRLGPANARKGTFTSRVLAAGALSRWGRFERRAEIPAGTSLEFEVHTGNSREPDSTWTDWAPVELSGGAAALEEPPARYIQYRAKFATASPSATPRLEAVSVAALPMNLGPEVKEITAGREEGGPGNGRPQPPQAQRNGSNSGNSGSSELSGTPRISWKAEDPNGDKLSYRLEFRPAGMERFVVLEEETADAKFSWDTTTVPDGDYYLRVVASDGPSNPGGTELEGSLAEGPFTVDNTSPTFSQPEVALEGAARRVTVEARDAGSPLRCASWSVDGSDWRPVFPDDRIFDSPAERLSVTVEKEDPALLVIRARDRAGNTSAVKVVFEAGR